MDNSLITWLLVVVCTPHCIRNPYLIAKIIEVLFVINPSVQVNFVCTYETRIVYEYYILYVITHIRIVIVGKNGNSL